MQRTGATEGDECEVTRVVSALNGDEAQRARHVLVDDLDDALSRRVELETDGVTDLLHGRARGLNVELHLATEQAGWQVTDDDIGVRHGRLLTALAVGSGTWLGTGRLRTDAKRLGQLWHVGNRAATSTNGVHVDRRHLQAELTDCRVATNRRLAILAERHVCRRATHVERQDVLKARTLRDVERTRDAAGRTGQHAVDRVTTSLTRRHQACVRAQDVDVAGCTGGLQLDVESIDVGLNLWAHIRVHAGGQRALVLAELRYDIARERDGEVRVETLDDGADLLLVLVRDVRVDQTNGQRLNATLDEVLDDLLDLSLVDCDHGLATRAHALDSLAGVGQRGRRLGLLHDDPTGEGARGLRACKVQNLGEPLGCDQTHASALALEHGVCRDSRAMHDVAKIGGRDARRFAHACQSGQHALGRVTGRRRGLDAMLCSVVIVDEKQVGECSTDVYS